ncbi:MAG: hypothetical protein E7680_03490 [Ruminococcaceae bacterium]|nr:hypothetical protein [Oscillospiraceae bacterium]
MTYVIANPCGNLEKFQNLLSKIKFSDADTLYVIGNLADFGPDPIGLVEELSYRPNIYPVAGERDYLAARLLSGFDKMSAGKAPEPGFAEEMGDWVRDGGLSTMEGYRNLDADGREGILDYLCEMPLFEELNIKGKTYVLVYAGIAGFEKGDDPADFLPDDFFSEPLPKDVQLMEDATVIVGGVPTESGKIERGRGSIYLDCGSKDGGALAALCLETGEEFYAK